ncbi:uncharacterized protein LOC135351010 [Halichondria panicea]|uniref:uncharacterized protein LOC135351010 n=1 Tax=Halichondria panicea TaxID=6063 RepID=UPI00312B8833
MEISLTVEERLDKQRWYIGEVTQEVAESLLSSNKQPHSFVVFTQPDTRQYILSTFTPFPLEGLEDGVIEHLTILCEEGRWCITGQTDEYDDVIEAVNCYALTFDPPLIPLMPALQEKSFLAPPEYDKANKALKPDIAPLPEVKVADKKAVEAQRGRISPIRIRGIDDECRDPVWFPSAPSYSSSTGIPRTFIRPYPIRRSSYHERRSTWHRYSELHRCHPKNVCSGCFHGPQFWDGKAYTRNSARKWYNPWGSGPLRVLGLLLFLLFCFPCIGCYKCCVVTVRFCCCCCFDRGHNMDTDDRWSY